jgi:hypothetical protein
MDTKHSGLVGQLYSDQVLDHSDKEDIEAKTSSTRRNERLLSVLSRKSTEQFELFLNALDSTGQQHITATLRGQDVDTHDTAAGGQQGLLHESPTKGRVLLEGSRVLSGGNRDELLR